MNLVGKRVLLYGLGLSGRSALKLLNREGASVFAVSRGPLESWPVNLVHRVYREEEGRWEDILPSMDFIVLSPGIPRCTPLVVRALQEGKTVMGEVELAYGFMAHETLIAVTGTNGKTTTASMLKTLLEGAGKSVFLGGNIGTPFCEYILAGEKKEFIVLELSSFQLESLIHFRPHLGLFLNATDHHGERYERGEDYLKAKSQLALNMTSHDTLLYPDEPRIDSLFQKGVFKRIKISPSLDEAKKILSPFNLSKRKIPGEHNLINFLFVLKVAELLCLPPSSFKQLFHGFTGFEHRFETVDSPLAKLVINDSKSTNFASTLSALYSLKTYWGDIFLILGGQRRGRNDSPSHEFTALANRCCHRIIVQGESAPLLEDSLGREKTHRCQTLKEAVDYLKNHAHGRVVLFSPAFPSFDQFENYRDRGNTFKKWMTNGEK